MVVQGEAQRVGGEPRLQVGVGYLGEGMHAGVGAARAVDLEGLAPRRLADRGLQLPLDRARVPLDLPAAVARPGVLEAELEAGHASRQGDARAAPGPARYSSKSATTAWGGG